MHESVTSRNNQAISRSFSCILFNPAVGLEWECREFVNRGSTTMDTTDQENES
jgi:hypothetical protein